MAKGIQGVGPKSQVRRPIPLGSCLSVPVLFPPPRINLVVLDFVNDARWGHPIFAFRSHFGLDEISLVPIDPMSTLLHAAVGLASPPPATTPLDPFVPVDRTPSPALIAGRVLEEVDNPFQVDPSPSAPSSDLPLFTGSAPHSVPPDEEFPSPVLASLAALSPPSLDALILARPLDTPLLLSTPPAVALAPMSGASPLTPSVTSTLPALTAQHKKP
ncbi:hypothetical protein HDU67_001041 [Dinochytrium kinnereticum]|nr:hypothetical protein HDU67_001041 [Dinochytrium kinnereticum]